ncbi:uncharacterized protein LOC119359221 [Triticum dicoccoides]|nr:uncharacterized protein LOC119359221 [Triticum dicoccoides]
MADGPPAPWPARSLLAAACPSSMDGLHRELIEVVPFIPDLQLQVTNDATKRKKLQCKPSLMRWSHSACERKPLYRNALHGQTNKPSTVRRKSTNRWRMAC